MDSRGNLSKEQAAAGTGIAFKEITEDQEIMYMKGLPKRLRNFLKYEAIADFHPGRIYRVYRKYGQEDTLTILRYEQRILTQEAYGPNHPQSCRGLTDHDSM